MVKENSEFLFLSARSADEILKLSLTKKTLDEKLLLEMIEQEQSRVDGPLAELRVRTLQEDIKALQESPSEPHIATNFNEAIFMLRSNTNIDVVLAYRLREKDMDIYTLLKDYMLPEVSKRQNKPVFVLFYQTVYDALTHARNMGIEMQEDDLHRLKEDFKIVNTIMKEKIPGVIFSETKRLDFAVNMVAYILMKKEEYFKPENAGKIIRTTNDFLGFDKESAQSDQYLNKQSMTLNR